MNNVRILSRVEQNRMVKNGWELIRADRGEHDEQLFNRLKDNYSKVKIYKSTTYVRGYYSIFAFVKGDK